MSSEGQLYSLLFSREEIDDANATWIAAQSTTKAGEFSEALQVYFEEVKNPISFELYSHRQIVEYGFHCNKSDYDKIQAGIHVMLGGAWIAPREDYTHQVSDNAVILASEFTALCAHAMAYLTYHELVCEVMSPLLNVLSLLPVEQHCILQFVVTAYPDDAKRNFEMRLSMFWWLLVYLRNPYQWFWPGTYERHLWANKRMKGPMFHTNLRILLWEEDRSNGDPEIEREQLESLELSMESIQCPLRYQDMHALGICKRDKTFIGPKALEPFQKRELKRPYVLSGDELATYYHPVYIHKHPHIKSLLAATASLPPGLSGMPRTPAWSFFAHTRHQGVREPFGIKRVDRLGQLHVLGKSGSGKSKLLELLIREDLKHGKGFAFIDCHGDMTEDILRVVPEERIDDVYLLDFSDRDHPPKLNPLTMAKSKQHELFMPLFLELLCESAGVENFSEKSKRFLKHALAVISEQDGVSIGEILHFLIYGDLRDALVHQTKNPSAKEYFASNASEVDGIVGGGDILQLKIRLAGLLATNLVSDVVQQEHNYFDFESIINNNKILLVRVPKQSLGNHNTEFLGSMVLLMLHCVAEYQREKGLTPPEPYYVYIDEFQNFASPSFAKFIDGAAKRGLSYTLSHQTLGQISSDMVRAMREGIQNLISFQLGGTDAQLLGEALAPSFGAGDVMNLGVRQFYIRMTVDSQPTAPFSGETDFVSYPEQNFAEAIVRASRSKVSVREGDGS